MNFRKTLFVIFIIPFIFIHCEEDNEPTAFVYYQYEYINYAWGYQHNGWFIDTSGYVLCYNNPDPWYFPDSSRKIPEYKLLSNMNSIDVVCSQVDKSDVAQKSLLITKASQGELSEPFMEMADAGSMIYRAYLYDETKKEFQSVLLKQLGDYRIENYSEAAEELFLWMDSLNDKIMNAK